MRRNTSKFSSRDAKSMKSKSSSGTRRKRKMQPKKRKARNLFRALVRKVMANIYWLSDTTDRELGTNAELNFYILTHKRKKRLLSLDDKVVLRSPKEERTPERLDVIAKKLGVFKSFRNYPYDIKKELLLRARFECWEKDRVIVRQGHDPQFVYFVVGGTVDWISEFPHPIIEDEMIKHVDKLGEGENFGELAVLYKEPHQGTVIVSSDYVEVLVLTKQDFVDVLEETVKKQWDCIRWALEKFPHFDKFPEFAIRNLCSISSLVTYPVDTIVPMQDEFGTDIASFIVDGTCKVLQTIYVVEDMTSPVHMRYELYSETVPENLDNLPKNVKGVIMEVCTLMRKCVFNVGDVMSKNTIITDSECMILTIPKNILVRYDVNNIWSKIVATIDMTYPKTMDIFEAYVNNKKWISYKRNLRKEVYSKYRPNDQTFHDAPVMSRAKMLRLRGKLYETVVKMPYYSFGELDIDDTMKMIEEHKQVARQNLAARMTNDKSEFETTIRNLREEYLAKKEAGQLQTTKPERKATSYMIKYKKRKKTMSVSK